MRISRSMIKRRLSTIIIIVLAFILWTTTFQSLKLADVAPNIMLILVVCYAYMRGRTSGLLIGFFCGLLSDMMYGTVVGLYAFGLMTIGFLCGHSQKVYFTDNYILPCVLVGISDFAYNIYYYVTEFLVRGRLDFKFYFLTVILPEMIYTMLLAVVVFRLLTMLESYLMKKREEE